MNYLPMQKCLKAVAAAALPLLMVATAGAQTPNAGLKLPAGFSATVLAENLGRTRHLVVTPQHDIYVRLARTVNGKGTLMLHEEGNKATVQSSFGNFSGTGIYMRDGWLYTASNSEVFRYKLDGNNHVIDTAAPEKIVTGLVDRGQHETKSIMMNTAGDLFIPIGAPSNSCQQQDRQKGSLGQEGCPLLETAGGVWKFSASKPAQTYADGERYATGLRNVVAVDWNTQTNKLYVMQHGRDQLNTIFPDLYTVKDNAELPAECLFALNKGDNAGWPYTYYDRVQKKKMLAPEYGGDGKKEATGNFIDPAAAFPAHMAPNGLVFYNGTQFPEKYRNGAFIAFHGSWNRSPEPQAGYFVVFQPFKNGVASGDWEVFADNFSGSPEKTASGRADHRPCGLAIGPDGSLYVSDDAKGTIYKLTYTAPAKTKATAATPSTGVKPKATATKTAVKAPVKTTQLAPTKAMLAAGRAVYMQSCVTCHQKDGGGVMNINPPLIKTSFVLGEKPKLISVLLKGLKGKEIDGETYNSVMPAFNYLKDDQIAAVLSYVRNTWGNKASAVSGGEVKTERSRSK